MKPRGPRESTPALLGKQSTSRSLKKGLVVVVVFVFQYRESLSREINQSELRRTPCCHRNS